MLSKVFKFKQKITISDPLRVFFLCGTKYRENDLNDKRNVLKSYLESISKNNKVIILEEHFIFGKTRPRYLSYDDIFLNNLKDVEQLAGFYSDTIFIIHESISTAAELGMFASDKNSLKKICLITPDTLSVEEEKISSFIRLAFLNTRSNGDKIRNIHFYPKVEENIVSETKTDYYTYFPNNKISNNLAANIRSFLDKDYDPDIEISFKKNRYNRRFEGESTVSYFFDNSNLNVYISSKVIRVLLISIFNIPELRSDIRKSSSIKNTVTLLAASFKFIIMHSISHFEGKDLSSCNVNISLTESNLSFRQIIGYFLYLLQALGMINLPIMNVSESVTINSTFKYYYKNYENILEEIKSSKLADSLE